MLYACGLVVQSLARGWSSLEHEPTRSRALLSLLTLAQAPGGITLSPS